MIRTSCAYLLAISFLAAQTPAAADRPRVEVATEAAACSVIAPTSICFNYFAPVDAETAGVFEPGAAAIRITGLDQQPVTISATGLSPVARQWLKIRSIGGTDGETTVTGTLPMDLEVYVDESELGEAKTGRFVAILSVWPAGAAAPLKVPVQLAVGAPTDYLRAEPDSLAAITVKASPANQPSRFFIDVTREGAEAEVNVSVTPETSDGGSWLTANMQFGTAQCANQPAPCSFEAVITPPAVAGEYWGVLVITGYGFADRVPVQITVEAALGAPTPVTIEPRQISLSAPEGSRYAVSANVTVSGGTHDGVQYRAQYNDPWLAVEPSIGTWPVTLRLVMSPYGLEPGVYTDVVVLRSVDTGEVLATIPVRFNVIAPTLSPSVMDGGGWRTRFYLVNPTPVEARATLTFWTGGAGGVGINSDKPGAPWLVGVAGKGLATRVENEVIPPGGLRVIETDGSQSRLQQGWVEMRADGPVAMHTVLSQAKSVSRWLPVEATVPMLNPYRDHILVPFDNLNGALSSISLANADDEPVTVEVSILNENGAEMAKEDKFTLAGHEGKTVALAEKWKSAVDRRGLVSLRFDGGRLFAIGLRELGKGFHTYPAVACAELGLDRGLPNVNVGGAWQSTAYLANTTSLGQYGLLRLWPDKSRFTGPVLNDESAPIVPPNGILTWQAPVQDTTRPSGGWLESRFTKQVNGFMLLKQSYAGSPAAPRMENYETALTGLRGLLGRLAIPYDNRENYSTQIVLVNPSDTATDIQPVVYDLLGRYPRFLDAFRLPAHGQLAVNAADRWELGTPQGILQFTSRQGVPLTGVALRSGDGATTILPAYEK